MTNSSIMRTFVERPRAKCMKKSAFPSMHSWVALPQASLEYMKRKCAQLGASLLTCRSKLEIVVVFPKIDYDADEIICEAVRAD